MKQRDKQVISPVEYQKILHEMVCAYALHEIIVDAQNQPVDYRFIDVNPAFERLTGLARRAILGKTVREVLPASAPEWIARFGKVALGGGTDAFENFSVDLGKFFQVNAFCPKPGHFAVTFNDITSQVETRHALQIKNQTLKKIEPELCAIYQSTPILMFVVDNERRIVKINQATASFTGRSEQETIGLSVGELFGCSQVQTGISCGSGNACNSCRIENSILETLLNGTARQGVRATLEVKGAQGLTTKHLLLSTTPLIGTTPGRVLVCIDDISAYVQEQNLRFEGEARYQALVEKGFDGIFIYRQDRIVDLNQQLADILGYKKEELLGTSPLDLVMPGFRELIRQQVRNGTSKIFQIDLRHRSGRLVHVETFGVSSRFRGEDARIVAVRDVTARTEADEKLRNSEQRYARLFKQFESLLDAVSDPITLLTSEFELLWTNQAFEQLKDELDTDETGLIFQRFLKESENNPIRKCLATGRPAECQVRTPDQRIWEYRAFPLRQEDGGERQVITISSDISEKVRLREEANRSSRLAALGELAAGVAHEINNPNALILYNSELVRTIFQELLPGLDDSGYFGREQTLLAGLPFDELRTEIPELLSSMHESSVRIKRIVDDLRNFSHEDEGSLRELIDFNQVVEASIRLVNNTLKQSTDSLDIQLASDIPGILGSAGRLEQVIINLLLNACQALESPEQQIRVRTCCDNDSGQVMLQITDQGRGIANELIERLAEPFFTTRREQGGTGLGLSVSSRIAKEHGGQLHFASEPGVGTTVTLTLPIFHEGEN